MLAYGGMGHKPLRGPTIAHREWLQRLHLSARCLRSCAEAQAGLSLSIVFLESAAEYIVLAHGSKSVPDIKMYADMSRISCWGSGRARKMGSLYARSQMMVYCGNRKRSGTNASACNIALAVTKGFKLLHGGLQSSLGMIALAHACQQLSEEIPKQH